jgi:hypothetical protein
LSSHKSNHSLALAQAEIPGADGDAAPWSVEAGLPALPSPVGSPFWLDSGGIIKLEFY